MYSKDKDKKVDSTDYTLPIIFSVLALLGLVAFYFYFKVDHGTKDSQRNRGPRAIDIYNETFKDKIKF